MRFSLKKIMIIGFCVIIGSAALGLINKKTEADAILNEPLAEIPGEYLGLYEADDLYYKLVHYSKETKFRVINTKQESNGYTALNIATSEVDMKKLSGSYSETVIESEPCQLFEITLDAPTYQIATNGGTDVLTGIEIKIIEIVVPIKGKDKNLLEKVKNPLDPDQLTYEAGAIINRHSAFWYKRTNLLLDTGWTDEWSLSSELTRIIKIVNNGNSNRIKNLFIPKEMSMAAFLAQFTRANGGMAAGEEKPNTILKNLPSPPELKEEQKEAKEDTIDGQGTDTDQLPSTEEIVMEEDGVEVSAILCFVEGCEDASHIH